MISPLLPAHPPTTKRSRLSPGENKISRRSYLQNAVFGTAPVTDAELLRQTLERGVGRGRAGGYGLLSLAR